MRQGSFKKRVGRPDREDSQALVAMILATATRLFKDQGYAATSIEQIATLCGSGKQTIYRRFESKERLFQAVLDARVASVNERIAAGAAHADPMRALRTTTRELFEQMLQPDSVAFQRVLIAEAARFPQLVGRTFDHTIGPFRQLTIRLLQDAMVRGLLHTTDPERLCGLLTGMITGWPHQQALLGRDVLATARARAEYFASAWELFLAGAAVGAPFASKVRSKKAQSVVSSIDL